MAVPRAAAGTAVAATTLAGVADPDPSIEPVEDPGYEDPGTETDKPKEALSSSYC